MCVTCALGTFLKESSASSGFDSCSACSASTEYVDHSVNSQGVCKACSDKFANCSTCNIDQCLTCSTSFYLYLFKNGNASDDCVACDQNTQYTTVVNGVDNCRSCDTGVENCLVCNNSSSKCSKCKPGFYLSGSNGVGTYSSCVECEGDTLSIIGGHDGTGKKA